uniref:Glutaredoxin domain-containing protein n=1 Tax=Steinernema glaseri TaxID=37863 RepID=A0A1I8AV84_9BILA
MSHAKEFVENAIHGSKVCVFSKSYDHACQQTRAALNSFQLAPDVLSWIEIENRGDSDEIQDYLKQLTGDTSLPRVFFNGAFVGGADDTLRAKENGSLERNLEDIGAIDHFTTWS